MKKEIEYRVPGSTTELEIMPKIIEDHRDILNRYGLKYRMVDQYLQVGEINWVQGWILHISVILPQIDELLSTVLPIIIEEGLPFKVTANLEITRGILNGQFGYEKLGKVLSLYPANDMQALRVAQKLIELTVSFKGPRILTDRHLGSVIYARYGACNPIIVIGQGGLHEKCIYDNEKKLVKDEYKIPFSLPFEVNWPFGKLASLQEPRKQNVLQDKYKPLQVLKPDAKGSVMKAIGLSKMYMLKWCVIKEGKQYMNTDLNGRDIGDRLKWQFELSRDLQGIVPLPIVYDLFEENGDTFLIMEFIKGMALDDVLLDIFHDKTWHQLDLGQRMQLLDYADQILDIIQKMHAKGYIHRDITTVNFLVNKKQQLWMIDLELAYCARLRKPYPPFLLGTTGFMSPEQIEGKMPTIEQDLYSLGAILIPLFTSLLPGKFATLNKEDLKRQLNFFIPNTDIVDIIGNCFDSKPEARPSVQKIKEAVGQFRVKQYKANNDAKKECFTLENRFDVKEIITKALVGLGSQTMMAPNHLWFSKTVQDASIAYYQMESGTVYAGFYEGLSGVLYLLARANKLGFSITSCALGYKKSWEYLKKNYCGKENVIPAGLYGGTAGIALALTVGIDSGLITLNDETEQVLCDYLVSDNLEGLGVVKGIAGQGFALLKAIPLSRGTFFQQLLDKRVEELLHHQQNDGSFLTASHEKKKSLKFTGFGHGVAGISCFLSDYLMQYKNNDSVREAIVKAQLWLKKQSFKKGRNLVWPLSNRSKDTLPGFQEGCAGIVLSFIKAYEALRDPFYLEIAEKALKNYPVNWPSRDISQANGLTGIGEIYLEAARVFNSSEWLERAGWITQYLLHHFVRQVDDSIYWLVDHTPYSTADFMTGNSGIIHFLLHYFHHEKLKFPF